MWIVFSLWHAWHFRRARRPFTYSSVFTNVWLMRWSENTFRTLFITPCGSMDEPSGDNEEHSELGEIVDMSLPVKLCWSWQIPVLTTSPDDPLVYCWLPDGLDWWYVDCSVFGQGLFTRSQATRSANALIVIFVNTGLVDWCLTSKKASATVMPTPVVLIRNQGFCVTQAFSIRSIPWRRWLCRSTTLLWEK